MPKLPTPRRAKTVVLVGLVVVYAGAMVVLTRHPKPTHTMEILNIPVDVVRTARHVPPAPPLVVQLQPVAPVEIAPPVIAHTHGH